MRFSSLLVLLVLIGLVGIPPAAATVITGRSSTVLEWYDMPDGETAVPVYEYLQLRATDLGGKGYHFYGYGRLAEDLADEDDSVGSELYSAYVDKKWAEHKLDLRFGRQFISTTAGASVMDGARVKMRNLAGRPLALTLFGGGDVAFDETYRTGDWLIGGEARYDFDFGTNARFSYLQKWDDSDLAFELIGFDANHAYRKILDTYGELQFDLLSESISYFLLGADYHRASDWSLRTEYLYSLPVFASTSIYSVFAVSEYEELMVEYTRYLAYDTKAFGRVSYEMYVDFDDAQLLEAGVEKMMMRSDWGGYAVGTVRLDGDGQELYGIKLHGSYRVMPDVRAGLGAHVDVLERRLEDDDETTSSRIWADATYTFSKRMSVEGKLEYLESDLWDYQLRGRLRLNWTF